MIGSRLRPTRRAPTAAPPKTRSTRRSARELAVGHPRSECLVRGSGTGSVERTTEATSEGRPTRSWRSRRIASGAWSRVAVRAVGISRTCRRLVGSSPARVGAGRASSAQCLAVLSLRATDVVCFADALIRIPVVGVAGAESRGGSDAGGSPAETVVCGSGSGAAVGAGSDCATGGGAAGAVAATGGDVEVGGSGAGGASGGVGGWEAPRGGRSSSGSIYVSASPTRMPKCT
jgi:hypothetical protein